ncbi:MAG: hypothetical protein ACI85V_002839, partial [bacterium]
STTTARFMGTCSALEVAPRKTRSVSAALVVGTVAYDNAKPARAALKIFEYVMVTCLSDHASLNGS